MGIGRLRSTYSIHVTCSKRMKNIIVFYLLNIVKVMVMLGWKFFLATVGPMLTGLLCNY